MRGIGLGLVICRMIVKKFNGTINFISEYEKGSTFFFSFELESISSEDIIEVVSPVRHDSFLKLNSLLELKELEIDNNK